MLNWNERRAHLAKLSHRSQVYFALFCAKQVFHLIESDEARECVRLVDLWLDGKASSEECYIAANAAGVSVGVAAFAVYAAANAAHNVAFAVSNMTANTSNVARISAVDTAYIASNAAANAIYAVSYDASDDGDSVFKEAQMAYLEDLINIDQIVESTLLR